jgi:biopolymer transport protein ExbD
VIKIRPKTDYLVALESVAMTDIVLNMFIFFFISFSLLYTFSPARVSKIDMRLPEASSAVSLEGSDKIVLAVTRKGEFFVDDERSPAAAVKEKLRLKIRENPSAGVILKVDALARFDSVVKALDAINDLGIRKVNIAAAKETR